MNVVSREGDFYAIFYLVLRHLSENNKHTGDSTVDNKTKFSSRCMQYENFSLIVDVGVGNFILYAISYTPHIIPDLFSYFFK